MRRVIIICCALALRSPVPAQAAEAIATPRLSVQPASVELSGPDDRMQLLVTLEGVDAMPGDATLQASYQISAAGVVDVLAGVVRPLSEGEAMVEVRLPASGSTPELSAQVPVRVSGFATRRPLNFTNDIEPLLSKHSCNSGGCHGKASGQNGFKLSLLGFDPAGDYEALVKQAHGRRVFPAAPERSLLLSKPTSQTIHGGGKRFDVDSPAYRVLRRWIAEGMPYGAVADPQVVAISVMPAERLMRRLSSQQLRVVATYSDKTTRDVTAEAEYRGQQPDLLAVTPTGLATTLDATGEGTVMVRYLGLVEVSRITVPFGEQVPPAAYAAFQPKSYIDEFALKKWHKLGVVPSPRASDAEFLRRAFLDCIGTLPTPDETRAFLADAGADKRARLVDQLLERDEYASFWAVKWGDLLRNKRRGNDNQKRGTYAFAAWIRGAFKQNMPYDQFASAVLTAQGGISDSPPVAWYREVRNIVHQVNDTCQLFLGTRINCANCHHHPYERWSQDDYWHLAGFFARLGSKQGDFADENVIFVRKDGETRNPRTGELMKPKALGGPEHEYVRGEDPRQLLVAWMVAPDNPYFARAIANRMWAHFLGVGLVEAVDDLRITNPPSNPELLDALSKDFVAHHFDLKHLIRSIMMSEVYGLSSTPTPYNDKDRLNYARFRPKRMSAEVLLDAVDSVTAAPEKFNGFPQGTRAIELPDESVGSYFLDVFGRSQRDTPCECERSYAPNLAQVLHLMNSPELQSKMTSGQGRIAQMITANKPAEEQISELYLAAFSRLPETAELSDAAGYINAAQDKRVALTDLLWVLLNSKEFLFNH